ncbi:unnamed protein product [Rotaria sp. Silwood2]|nr:unnamed protein product [Rotaria sp. Silwood2]
MTVRICSHRLSMQSDVLNDQQQLSNDIDCSSSLSTTLIYSGLKLQPKPLLPTISMSSMASPVSIVKKLSLPDTHPDHLNKSLASAIRHSPTPTTPSSIRLVTPTTGKLSPPTTLQFQFVDKSSSSTTTTNGGFSTSKTYIFNPQQTNSAGTPSSSSSSLVTLIPPGTTSPKIQTLISSTNDISTNNDHNNIKQSSFLSKNRLTLVQPIITNSSSTSTSSTNSVTPKLVIQQNSTSNIWSQQTTTKILSAKMLSRPVHLISSNEHSNLSSPTSNDNPIFTTKNLDSGHQAVIHMSLLQPTSSSESINSVQLTNFYSTPSSVRISTTTQRSMDHNNNHSVTTPIIREIQTDEKLPDSTIIKNIHHNKNSIKNRTRLPLQPSTQQISSILPPTKKHKLPEDEQVSLSEPPNKIAHYEQFDASSNGKKIRKCRHKPLSKISLENTTPNPAPSLPLASSIGVDPNERIISKKRSSAEIATAAILSSNYMRKKRIQRKNSDETISNNINNNNIKHESISINDSSNEIINDELLKRLAQDFVYVSKQTGIRWIGTKTRSKPMNTLLSRVSWKPKINHYEKYSDIIRMNPKRTVPIKSLDTIRRKLTQPWSSWRIDRLTTYLTDLVK